MSFTFCGCHQVARKMRVKKDKSKLVRLIQKASRDPLYGFKRQCIVSQINQGTKLDILEMGDYTPVEVVGTGTSSDVWSVVRKRDGQKFAMKFLKHEISTREFINEATLLKSCSNLSANIVNLVGITTTPKSLVFDFYANGSLDQAFKKDNFLVARGNNTEFTFFRRLGYILDLCKAVHHLHRENICHRDIAMRNLLLSDDKKHVLLSDFSLSRVVSTALVTQSTLTTLVPIKSAPETILEKKGSKYGRENWESYYSLNSDIWSLGVTMFEIIEMEELGDIDWGKKMPRGFSEKRLPSTKVFNRIQDLWILILRCWNKRPQDRPQIWNVHEQIEKFLAHPWYVRSENDGYIRAPNIHGTSYGSTFDNQKFQSSWSGMSADYVSMYADSQDEQCPESGYLNLESPMGWHIADQDSSKIITPSEVIDFPPQLSSVGIRSDKEIGAWSLNTQMLQSPERYRDNRINDESNCNMHLSPPSRNSCRKVSTYTRRLNREHQQSMNFRSRWNISDALISNTPGTGLRFLKRLDSVSSFTTNYTSSEFEGSMYKDRVEYCSPLPVSFNSTPTNTRYCKDRQFFSNTATDFNVAEKPYSPDYLYVPNTPESEAACEQSLTCDLSETPRFCISV